MPIIIIICVPWRWQNAIYIHTQPDWPARGNEERAERATTYLSFGKQENVEQNVQESILQLHTRTQRIHTLTFSTAHRILRRQ